MHITLPAWLAPARAVTGDTTGMYYTEVYQSNYSISNLPDPCLHLKPGLHLSQSRSHWHACHLCMRTTISQKENTGLYHVTSLICKLSIVTMPFLAHHSSAIIQKVGTGTGICTEHNLCCHAACTNHSMHCDCHTQPKGTARPLGHTGQQLCDIL